MTLNNVYDKLYTSIKNDLTLVDGDNEYSLGDYMMMKAGKNKEAKASNLPVAKTAESAQKAIVAFFTYVNDKLTVKRAPVKDKTIRTFPFRTSLATALCAVVACTLLLSFGLKIGNMSDSPFVAENTKDSTSDVENTEIDENNYHSEYFVN